MAPVVPGGSAERGGNVMAESGGTGERAVPSRRRTVETTAVVGLAGLVLGGLTSPAQGLLPEAVASFANSVSGWTVLAAALVWFSRASPGPAVLLGPVSFVALVLGYTVVASLRGLYYDPTLWALVGLVGGPGVGIATSWVRCGGWRAALGAGGLSGILVGDACYGLTVVAATTHQAYWILVGVAGTSVLPITWLRTAARPREVAAGVVTALIVAIALLVGYAVLSMP